MVDCFGGLIAQVFDQVHVDSVFSQVQSHDFLDPVGDRRGEEALLDLAFVSLADDGENLAATKLS